MSQWQRPESHPRLPGRDREDVAGCADQCSLAAVVRAAQVAGDAVPELDEPAQRCGFGGAGTGGPSVAAQPSVCDVEQIEMILTCVPALDAIKNMARTQP